MKGVLRHVRLGVLSIVCLTLLFAFSVVAAERCEEWACKAVSVQGTVLMKPAGGKDWVPVRMDDTFCPGDTIKTLERSRAAFILRNDSLVRIDQNTTITLMGTERDRTSVLDISNGGAFFFNRTPSNLRIHTPYVNAGVEGTEFFVGVERDRAVIAVLEGKVSASNDAGRVIVEQGQAATAQAFGAPILSKVIRPRDAVQWTVYFPPVQDYRAEQWTGLEPGLRRIVSEAAEHYRKGDPTKAFEALDRAPATVDDASFLAYRASMLLAVGRVEEALSDLDRAARIDPGAGLVYSLRSVIATARNEKEKAMELARRAVELDPASSTALIALSYAQQARFDVKGALESLKKAVEVNPQDAHAWARLSELHLSVKEHDKALLAAKSAVDLDPGLSRTQSVLGFAYLVEVRTKDARKAFKKAMALDGADPLPRLGLGLAMIRDGDLKGGRREIEIAALLDPMNSLIRSYLGKAYFDEKRDGLASKEFEQARELDPKDPTPWFYSAIMKETQNRPVEALDELEKSIQLNDNRAVYRSRLLLDEDLAARSASLAYIYRDLGFDRRAAVEGWKSLNVDPANYSAHRFLSDAYAAIPRHETARVSELLQAQLLQPLSVTPVLPEMAEKNLLLPFMTGPAGLSFSEYNSLFARNRANLLLTGIFGEQGTYADEAIVSGLFGRFSGSVGHLHYETDGFRDGFDFSRNVYNAFFQTMISPKLSVLGEYRNTDLESGMLTRRFLPEMELGERDSRDTESVRFGFHAGLSPNSDLIGHFNYRNFNEDLTYPKYSHYRSLADVNAFNAEAQYLYRSERWNAVAGAGHMTLNWANTETMRISGKEFELDHGDEHQSQNDVYLYTYVNWPRDVTWTFGAGGSFSENPRSGVSRGQFNPKFGVTWNPLPGTTLRAAAFRTLSRLGVSEGVFSGETIEPTQVAGFNQFFDDVPGTSSWRYGVGIDQKFSTHLFGGIEYSERAVNQLINVRALNKVFDSDTQERLGRAYLYWTPHPWVALGPEYQLEQLDGADVFYEFGGYNELTTHRLIFGVSFFHPSGLLAQIKPTMVFQNGNFLLEDAPFPLIPKYYREDTSFFVLNAVIGYRLPKRMGFIAIEARNLFDESFRFEEPDPFTMTIFPDRAILGRVTLFF